MKEFFVGLAAGALAGMAIAVTPKAQKLIREAKTKLCEKANELGSKGCGCGCGSGE